MTKYKVLVPFVNFSPAIRHYTQGDSYEPADAGEAERLIAAGTLDAKPLESPKELRAEPIETADIKPAVAEKAVKRVRKDK